MKETQHVSGVKHIMQSVNIYFKTWDKQLCFPEYICASTWMW